MTTFKSDHVEMSPDTGVVLIFNFEKKEKFLVQENLQRRKRKSLDSKLRILLRLLPWDKNCKELYLSDNPGAVLSNICEIKTLWKRLSPQ